MSTAAQGHIYDLDKKRADIIYQATDNTRQVKEVRWLNNNGKVSWIDHYNRYGYRFAQTYYRNEQPAWRKYYDKKTMQPYISVTQIVGKYSQEFDENF